MLKSKAVTASRPSTTTYVTAIDSFRIAPACSADPARDSANIMAVGPRAVRPCESFVK